MEQKEFGLGLTGENTEKTDTVSGVNEKNASAWQRFCARLPVYLVWARYLLPALGVLTVFVLGFFYNVRFISGRITQELSVWRLYANTFVGMHEYLGGPGKAGRSWFIGLLVAGAIVGILCFLAALFFAGLAAYTACRAFLAGHESEESDKQKLIFKVVFPNRVWLFLSQLLVLIPLLYPHFVSLVGGYFLAIGVGDVIFILLNRPLIVAGAFCVASLVLALIIPRFERRKRMNMFLLHRAIEKSEELEEETGEDTEE
jgi:hypothetical protein